MLRSIQSLIGFTMGATDGEIGKVKDFYFDDKTWRIKYLVVETGNWLFGRKVLLSPVALQTTNLESNSLPVNLTKDQIKHSPDIDTDKPVSAQQEAELHSHYSWPNNEAAGIGFMTTGMVGGVVAPGIPFDERISDEVHHHSDTVSDRGPENENPQHQSGDQHLRSFKDLKGYTIHASDGEFGEVDDLIVDSVSWSVPFMVIETGNWYSGKKILTTTKNIRSIEWKDSSVHVTQSTHTLKSSPEFDYSEPMDQETERSLYNFYQNS